jgi:hypothetical protein
MNALWLSLVVAASAFADLSNPPLLSYSTYLTGSKGSYGHGVAFDSAGNAYISGYALSQDFPFTLPPLGPPSSGPACCGYIAKLNPTGTAIVWSVRLNAPSAGPIALDAAGSIYVLGTSRRSDDSIASWAVTKITPSADRIVYSTMIPAETAAFVADPAGNVYVTGLAGPGFPTTPGAYLMQLATGDDAFVVKLNPTGAIVYATYTGMTGQGNAIAPDSQGNVWITGTTLDSRSFVAKLDAVGAKLLSSTQFGGGSEYVSPAMSLGIAVDSHDAAYVVGQAGLGVPTTPGSLEPFDPGHGDYLAGYLVKFSPNGDVVYGTYVGEDEQTAQSIAVDASGNAYVGLNGTYFINNAYPACVGNDASSLIVVSADGSK